MELQPQSCPHSYRLLGMGCIWRGTLHSRTTSVSYQSHRLGCSVRSQGYDRPPWYAFFCPISASLHFLFPPGAPGSQNGSVSLTRAVPPINLFFYQVRQFGSKVAVPVSTVVLTVMIISRTHLHHLEHGRPSSQTSIVQMISSRSLPRLTSAPLLS